LRPLIAIMPPPLLSRPTAAAAHHHAAAAATTSSHALAPLPSSRPRHRHRRRRAAAAAAAQSSSPAAAKRDNEEAQQQHQQPTGNTTNKAPLHLLTNLAPLAAGVLAARLAVLTARLLGLGRALPLLNGGRHPPAVANKKNNQSPTLSPALLPAGHDPLPPQRSPSGVRAPAIVWFRADLRTRDHAPLRAALSSPQVTCLLPVFVFDPREYPGILKGVKASSSTSCNTPTAGPRRAALVIGAVRELRASLRALGSDLLVRVGLPEEVLPRLASASGAARVYCHGEGAEGGAHELAVERAVARALRSVPGAGCELRAGGRGRGADRAPAWGAAGALLHPSDLPPSLRPSSQNKAASTSTTKAPTTAFGDFCQHVADVRVREPLGAPARLKGLPTPIAVVGGGGAGAAAAAASALDPGPIPSMRELGFAEGDLKQPGSVGGGEAEALRQLRALAAELKKGSKLPGGRRPTCSSASAAAAETSAASAAFAARISPWLAVGCLSPREVFAELGGGGKGAGGAAAKDKRSKKDKGDAEPSSSNNGWLAPQLLLRDFFGMLNAWRNQHQQVSGASVGASAPASAPAAMQPQLAFA
jgi:hypothetical protein